MKDRPKDAQEEADKEKAFKQVAEASLKEKVLGLNVMEQRATTARRALEQAKQKATDALNRVGEVELKLSKTASVLIARNKEFTDYEGGEKARKQNYYNKGFKHAEDSAGPVIFQARKFGFQEGWMAAVNAIGLPKESLFR